MTRSLLVAVGGLLLVGCAGDVVVDASLGGPCAPEVSAPSFGVGGINGPMVFTARTVTAFVFDPPFQGVALDIHFVDANVDACSTAALLGFTPNIVLSMRLHGTKVRSYPVEETGGANVLLQETYPNGGLNGAQPTRGFVTIDGFVPGDHVVGSYELVFPKSPNEPLVDGEVGITVRGTFSSPFCTDACLPPTR